MQRRSQESLFKTVKLSYYKRCHRFRCQILKLNLSLGNDIFAAITNNRRIRRCYPNQATEYIVVQLIQTCFFRLFVPHVFSNCHAVETFHELSNKLSNKSCPISSIGPSLFFENNYQVRYIPVEAYSQYLDKVLSSHHLIYKCQRQTY